MSALEPRRRLPPGRRLRRPLRAMSYRLAAGFDLMAAARRRDIARMVICWGDLVRG